MLDFETFKQVKKGECMETHKPLMEIIVRNECEKDYRRVEEIARAAFFTPWRIENGKIGCPYEHWMVNELRKRDGILALSLVAEIEGVVVGHVICNNATVTSDNNVLPVLNIGPVSVLPEFQRRGVGKALMKALIQKARELGFGAFLFFGRPEYYPKFGFKEASEFGITDMDGNNCPPFMGMELISGYLESAKGGKFYEGDIFEDELNRETVREFDKQFMAYQE